MTTLINNVILYLRKLSYLDINHPVYQSTQGDQKYKLYNPKMSFSDSKGWRVLGVFAFP